MLEIENQFVNLFDDSVNLLVYIVETEMINVYSQSLNRIAKQFINVGTATSQFANELGVYYINGKYSK